MRARSQSEAGRVNPRQANERRRYPHDPALKLFGFETTEQVARRDEQLRGALQRTGRHDLADDLQRGLDGREPMPDWSNSAYREYRRSFTSTATTLAYEAQEETGHFGVIVSVIPADLIATSGNLSTIMPREVRTRTWKVLDKAIRGFLAIGGLDVSFNERAGSNQRPGHYQAQLAVAVLGYPPDKQSREELGEALKATFTPEPTAHIPIQIKELRDPIEQQSYLMKRMFGRRVSIFDNRGRRNTLSLPLKWRQSAEIAAWLSGFPQTERLLLYGLRRNGSSIVRTGLSTSREFGE